MSDVPQRSSFVSLLFFFVVGLAPPQMAVAQLDNDLAPRAFEGNPRIVRIDGETGGPRSVKVFRIYTFDAAGRPLRVEQGSETVGSSLIVEVQCDDEGRVIRRDQSFMGNPAMRFEHAYDAAGRLVRIDTMNPRTDQRIERIEHTYDDSGRRATSTKSSKGKVGEVTRRTFDEEGRLIGEVVSRGGAEIRDRRLVYDENGCLVEDLTTLKSGKTSRIRFETDAECDPKRRQESSFAGRESTVEIVRDAEGRTISEKTIRDGEVVQELVWTYTSKAPETAPAVTNPTP